jgi:hypothetical protein
LLEFLRTNRSHGEVSLCVLALLTQSFVERDAAIRIAKARISACGKQDLHKIGWIKNDAAFEDAMERCVAVGGWSTKERGKSHVITYGWPMIRRDIASLRDTFSTWSSSKHSEPTSAQRMALGSCGMCRRRHPRGHIVGHGSQS